jgi:hypothetical protein
MTNIKDKVAHLRKRIKVAGIKARVRIAPGHHRDQCQVFPVAYEIEFTKEEQKTIATIAKINKWTLCQGAEIITDPDKFPQPHGYNFWLGAQADQ